MSQRTITNFGRNVSFKPAVYAEPADEQELLDLLRSNQDRSIRVIASGHAWSDAIKTSGLLINLKNLNRVQVTNDGTTAKVGAGCQIKRLVVELAKQGKTLFSSGLIDEQTVAGATATGTHGSGKHSLSQYIRSVRVAHFDAVSGEVQISKIEQAGDKLKAARCSLGLLGVIVEVELDIRPAYRICEHSQRHESLEQVLEAEHRFPLQQFFLMPWSWHWFGQHRVETDQPRSRSAGLYSVYWHLGIDWGLHLIILLMVKVLRFRFLIRAFYKRLLPLLIIRNWKVVDQAPKILTMQHELFRHIEIECFVTRSNLKAALDRVKTIIGVFGGQLSESDVPTHLRGSYLHHYPICIRRVLQDETLISMTASDGSQAPTDWYAISFICYETPSKREGFFAFANFLGKDLAQRFNARCHWGKYNPLDHTTNTHLYPQLKRFCEVANEFDPKGRFRNAWLEDVLFGDRDPHQKEDRAHKNSDR